MKVCIAEKPSVAREIARVLRATTKRDGYFEGNGYAVTYTFGHLCTLFEPGDYKSHWKRWDLNNLPMLPEKFNIKVNGDQGIQKQFNIIKGLFDKAEVVINCGDAGQEGELIQRWVMMQAGYSGKTQRLWISSLTEEAIQEGFKNLKPAEDYDPLFHAGFSRAIGDWLLGINATRLYTLRYGKERQVLSIGRVQTPTLAMVVERYLAILNFHPEPYWELQTTYRDTLFRYEEGRFLDKDEGTRVADMVKTEPFEVVKITKKKGKEYSPKLFDLTSLQVYCNTKFGLTAERTLNIVQKLYEQKLVTYPRVDTVFLPNDLFPKIPAILKGLSMYQSLVDPLLAKKIKKSTRVFNDKKVTDHHAIIPTGIEAVLQADHQKVYDIITRRFIASFYPDCEVSLTQVHGKVTTIAFKTNGKQVLAPGWKTVFEDGNTEEDANGSLLPAFVKGEQGPHSPSFLEKETKPPKQFTEATLLRSMETAGKDIDDDTIRELMKENGIGRPSTRASIIETLFKRKYIARNKKQVLPTVTGINLIKTIQSQLLKSAELTGHWERKLKEIEKGEYPASAFIKQMKTMVDQLVYEVRSDQQSAKIPTSAKLIVPIDKKDKKTIRKVVGSSCPKCKKGTLIKGTTAFGCSEYKNNCDFKIPFVYQSKKLPDKQILRLLDKGETLLLKGFKVDHETTSGQLVFDPDFHLKLMRTVAKTGNVEVTGRKICPKCKNGFLLKGKKAYGCSNYNKGCDFVYPFEKLRNILKDQPVTEELVYKVLSESQ